MLVLHHVTEPEKALAEAARALKPGGRLLVVDMLPHDRFDYREEMGHVWLGFAPDRLTDWLERAGLSEPRIQTLVTGGTARGPVLFVAAAVVPNTQHPPVAHEVTG